MGRFRWIGSFIRRVKGNPLACLLYEDADSGTGRKLPLQDSKT